MTTNLSPVFLAVAAMALSPLAQGCAPTAAVTSELTSTTTDTAALTAMGLDGRSWTLALHDRDKPLLLVFWASWCEPCNREAQAVEAYFQKIQSVVEFVGVNVDENPIDAEAFCNKYNTTYPSVTDGALVISDRFHIQATPTFLLLDRQGQEVVRTKRLDGPLQSAVLSAVANQESP